MSCSCHPPPSLRVGTSSGDFSASGRRGCERGRKDNRNFTLREPRLAGFIVRIWLRGRQTMMSYRLLFLDRNGLLVGKAAVHCRRDEEAIAVAEREVQKWEYVEVWKGGDPVCMCARAMKQEVRLAALLRSWRPRLLTRAGVRPRPAANSRNRHGGNHRL